MGAIVPAGADFSWTPAMQTQDLPPVQAFTAFESVQIAYENNGTTVKTARIIGPNSGLGSVITNPLNENAKRQELAAAYGGGLVGVAHGLALIAPGSGLLLAVTNGHAIIGGLVELLADPSDLTINTTIAVPNNTAHVFIWLQQNGVLTYKTDTSVPTGLCCYIGNCVTVSGNITSVDYSGVMFLRGPTGYRFTSDPFLPADAPPSTVVFWTRTANGNFMWDGVNHLPVTPLYTSPVFGRVQVAMANANYVATPDEYLHRYLEITGAFTADRFLTLPLIDGGDWLIHNFTTGGHNVGVSGPSGVGVRIPPATRARVVTDMTNFYWAAAPVDASGAIVAATAW